MKYLVPCPACGNKNPVELAQAGQAVVCTCGKSVDVPSIRALRQLEAVDDNVRPPRAWSKRQGLLFLGGTIAVIAGIAAAALFVLRPTTTGLVDPAAVRKEVDSLPADEGFIRFVLLQPWPPGSFAERLDKGQLPLHLLPTANLLVGFEGLGQQFIAVNQAVQVVQQVAIRNAQRKWMNDWLLNLSVVTGVGILIAGSALFVGGSEPKRRPPVKRNVAAGQTKRS